MENNFNWPLEIFKAGGVVAVRYVFLTVAPVCKGAYGVYWNHHTQEPVRVHKSSLRRYYKDRKKCLNSMIKSYESKIDLLRRSINKPS